MQDYLRRKFINWLAKDLYKTVTEDDFLIVGEKGAVKFKGQVLDATQKADLIRNAKDMLDNQMWQLMLIELSHEANKKMFFQSATMNDLVGGKLILWTLEQMHKKVRRIATLPQNK